MSNLKNAIIAAAIAGASSAAASPNIAIDRSAVEPVAQTIAARVEPIIQHATNTEPALQSRVTIGNAVTLLAVLAGAFGVEIAPDDQALLVTAISGAFVVGGAIYSLYGRWVAKKPLGS